MRKGPCDFPSFAGLSEAQQALIGGPGAWANLSTEQTASFLNITGAMAHAGVSLEGLKLLDGGIHEDRLLFQYDYAGGLWDQIKASISSVNNSTTWSYEKPSDRHHPGMSDWGARQNLAGGALQFGIGPKGAFVDLDFHNPQMGVLPALQHLFREVLPHEVDRARGRSGTTNPIAMGKKLGSNITGYSCD